MKNVKNLLIGAGVGAILVASAGAAVAGPAFTIDPSSIGITSVAPFTADTLNYNSDAVITQSGATQTEVGWAYITGFTLNGNAVDNTNSIAPGQFGHGFANTYTLYFKYTAVANLTGFNAATGTTSLQSFDIQLYADVGGNDVFSSGDATGATGITNTAGDLLLATGSLQGGVAGFTFTGAPTFSASEFFSLNNAYNFFTSPVPFYNLAFTSTTGSDSSVIHPVAGNPNQVALDGIVGSVAFVPEPITLSVFGAGLLGAGALRRRKSKKA